MIDQDISTHDSISLLSRRRFLQGMGATGVGLAVTNFGALAANAAPIGPSDQALVVLTLGGGNDGFNTVVPTGYGKYYDVRKRLAIPAASTIDIGNGFGFHPSLKFLKFVYDNGHMAVVNGVGYPNPSRSHFDSMAIWMRGQTTGSAFSGWVGRWLDGTSGTPLTAASIGSSVPLAMIGQARAAAAISPWGMDFGASNEPIDQRVYAAIRELGAGDSGLGPWGNAIGAIQSESLDVGRAVSPLFTPKLPETDGIVREMTLAARLIGANVGVKVLHLFHKGDYDTHESQLGDHARLLTELDNAISAFYAALPGTFVSRTTIMVISEFGREPNGNNSLGIDHGTAGTTMLIGRPVAGGLYGAFPSFTDLTRERQAKATVDFRSVYATVLETCLGADSNEILGASFEKLPLFSGAAPLDMPPPAPLPDLSGRLVAINPERRLDTRSGTGHPRAPISAGIEHTVQIAGVGAVPPTGVTSVILNVTVTNPTAPSWVTVWPTGEQRPVASHLNFTAGQTVPNLVLCKLGVNNRVSFYLNDGKADMIADVVGYNAAGGGSSLVPMAPTRLVDTRKTAAVGPKGVLPLKVAGVAGIPATGVGAVALNVTVAEPTRDGWVTVWPSGEPQPGTSNLNFNAGRTVPNLVVCKVGADGHVNLYNDTGNVHLIADVMAWFSASGSVGATAVKPVRLLDTRGSGKVGQDASIDLRVTGVAGVPANAKAVSLNITATDPSAVSYVTVWPAGSSRPVASNLNTAPGQTVPNQVIASVGSDGRISMYNAFGTVHLIADLTGYYV